MEELSSKISRVMWIEQKTKLGSGYAFSGRMFIDEETAEDLLSRELPGYEITIYHCHWRELIFLNRKQGWRLNLLLLLATICTTMLAGSIHLYAQLPSDPWMFLAGWSFSVAMLGILGSHELAHYLAARHHGVRVSLPYFIPSLPLMGTMGAIIRSRTPTPNRIALMDIGISGPLIGLIAALIVWWIGLGLEHPLEPKLQELEAGGLSLDLPMPLLLWLIPGPAGSQPKLLHPVAMAGWIGVAVTALNLIPMGQLDGGHVLRALSRSRYESISNALPMILVLGGFLDLSLRQNPFAFTLMFWGMLGIFLVKLGHPAPLEDQPLRDSFRSGLGIIMLGIGLCGLPLI